LKLSRRISHENPSPKNIFEKRTRRAEAKRKRNGNAHFHRIARHYDGACGVERENACALARGRKIAGTKTNPPVECDADQYRCDRRIAIKTGIQMNDAVAKIRMIKASLRCFAFGLLALLPVIGIPFGIVALFFSGQVRAGKKRFWNPAQPYWICGVLCAAIGIIFWSFIFILILWHIVNPNRD
jgi:hypothetical protein